MFNETENSWSVQTIKNEDYTVAKADGTVQEEHRCVLKVCTEGRDLFKEHEIKYDHERILAFDFIVTACDICPESEFYELEYTIGGKLGIVHRALFQLSDPVSEIRTVLAMLRRESLIPLDLVPHKLYYREDIAEVQVGKFLIDESGNPVFNAVHYPIIGSIANADARKTSASFRHYGDKGISVTYVAEQDIEAFPKVFVAGSPNVFDPEFSDQRFNEISVMIDNIEEASRIAKDYGLNHLFLYDLPDCRTGEPKMVLDSRGSYDHTWYQKVVKDS